MTADNRSVHTDALWTLGTIISENEKRDAIHIAVEPVVAGMVLMPGEPCVLRDGHAFAEMPERAIGVVDPFLVKAISKGERFWLLVKPRTITSLRHVWSHPDFPEKN